MIEGKWFAQGEELSQALAVRQAVFGRGRDALDDLAQSVVVYRAGQPVGAARLWYEDGAFRLGDVGVLEAARGMGYGDLLVRLLLYKALTHNASVIALTAPEALEPFFTRYGFAPDGQGGMSQRGEDVCLGCRAHEADAK